MIGEQYQYGQYCKKDQQNKTLLHNIKINKKPSDILT